MSIEGKHAYRFVYLQSDAWQTVRLDALVREGGKCQICGSESISNDAHHIWYPESIWDTTPEHLAILCRACHDLLHAIVPDCKTRDEGIGRDRWITFRNAMEIWRLKKVGESCDLEGPEKTQGLRTAYKTLKKKYHALHRDMQIKLAQARKAS